MLVRFIWIFSVLFMITVVLIILNKLLESFYREAEDIQYEDVIDRYLFFGSNYKASIDKVIADKVNNYIDNSTDKDRAVFDTFVAHMIVKKGKVIDITMEYKQTGKILDWEGKISKCVLGGEMCTVLDIDNEYLTFKGVDEFIIDSDKAKYKISYCENNGKIIENYKVIAAIEKV